MGLRDYYRQFEALSQEEINDELRARAQERRREELERSPTLDLSQITWPELPHPNVVNAITFAARSGLQHYPPQRAPELRRELAHRHGVDATRIAIGNGAAQLLSAAAQALLSPGQELLMPWPTYPLFPALAARTGATAVPVRRAGARALLDAMTDDTRLVAIASPNDPTGEPFVAEELELLLEGLPEEVALLLDEALVDFQRPPARDASLSLLQRHPRLIVVRSFSKAWGLAGLRIGYAIGGPGSEELLARIEPELGVGEIAQVGALEALRSCAEPVAARAGTVARERQRLAAALRERGFELSESQGPFVWAAHPALGAEELAGRLRRLGVLVASGAPLGEHRHVRIAVQRPWASDRLLDALAKAL